MFGLILDVFLIVLLSLTIGFCWKLNSKIHELKSGRKELLELIKTLDAGIIKTNANIHDLRIMTNNSSLELNTLVNKAAELIEDLGYMNDTAQGLADRLERNIVQSRHLARASNDDTPSPNPDLKPEFSKAREELMNALQNLK